MSDLKACFVFVGVIFASAVACDGSDRPPREATSAVDTPSETPAEAGPGVEREAKGSGILPGVLSPYTFGMTLSEAREVGTLDMDQRQSSAMGTTRDSKGRVVRTISYGLTAEADKKDGAFPWEWGAAASDQRSIGLDFHGPRGEEAVPGRSIKLSSHTEPEQTYLESIKLNLHSSEASYSVVLAGLEEALGTPTRIEFKDVWDKKNTLHLWRVEETCALLSEAVGENDRASELTLYPCWDLKTLFGHLLAKPGKEGAVLGATIAEIDELGPLVRVEAREKKSGDPAYHLVYPSVTTAPIFEEEPKLTLVDGKVAILSFKHSFSLVGKYALSSKGTKAAHLSDAVRDALRGRVPDDLLEKTREANHRHGLDNGVHVKILTNPEAVRLLVGVEPLK